MSSHQPPSTSSHKRSCAKKCLFGIVAACLGLVVLEGLASLVWTTCEMVTVLSNGPRVGELQEEYHCQYDPELGWVNRPGVSIADFYGPDRTITINKDGLRSHGALDSSLKDDAMHVVCLGDSFTLGYGVDDQETFPFMLQKKAAGRLRVSNMGQGGYSIGQNWLWLKRLAPKLKPNIVVCVFIVEDFRRLGVTRTANGFGVPRFEVLNENVRVSNIPVPDKLMVGSMMLQPGKIGNVLKRNSAVARSLTLLLPDASPPDDEENLINGLYIVREIIRFCEQQQCEMVFALTPTLPELFNLESKLRYENVASVLKSFMAREKIPFTNLQAAFPTEPQRANELFLEEAFHHYSASGNAIVAIELQNWLSSIVKEFPKQP